MSLTAQTYLISQTSDAFYRSHLFVKLHDELEVIDTQFVPTFVEKDLYFDSLRKKWFRKGTAELTITNRKIFNLEFAKEAFPRHKVLVLDIGMTKSSLVVFQDGVFKVKEEELGMGQGLFNLLTPTKNRDEIFDFIPSGIDRQQVFDYLAEKTQYPARLPATERERLIEFAAVKQIIKQFSENNQQSFLPPRQSIRDAQTDMILKKELSPSGVLIFTGETFWDNFKHNGFNTGGLGVLSWLHGADVSGVWKVFHDGSNLVPALGRLKKEGVINIAIDRYLKKIGTVIVLTHAEPEGKTLGSMEFDLGFSEPQKIDVVSGQIIRLPFDGGTAGALSLSLNDTVEIDGLTGGQLRQKPDIVGGELGIVIDARPRPLPHGRPSDEVFSQWLEGVGIKI